MRVNQHANKNPYNKLYYRFFEQHHRLYSTRRIVHVTNTIRWTQEPHMSPNLGMNQTKSYPMIIGVILSMLMYKFKLLKVSFLELIFRIICPQIPKLPCFFNNKRDRLVGCSSPRLECRQNQKLSTRKSLSESHPFSTSDGLLSPRTGLCFSFQPFGPVWQDSGSFRNSSGSGSSEKMASLKEPKYFQKTFGKTAPPVLLKWMRHIK